ETKNFDIAVDPTLLPADVANGGSVAGTVILTYLNPVSSATGRPTPLDTTPPPTSSISVTIVATVKPSSSTSAIPPLASRCQADGTCWTETALFIPGVKRTSDTKNQ